MKRILLNISLLGLAFLFVQCSTDQERGTQFVGDPVPVVVQKTARTSLQGQNLVSGRLEAKNTAHISTRMMGYVSSIAVEVGQAVKKRQPLIQINSADIAAKGGQVDAQITQAQANYDNAKKDYERFQNLFAAESASQKELDDMKTRFEMAKAGLKAAQQMRNEVNAQSNYTSITSPIDGVVTAKMTNQGDIAHPGMPLLVVESTDDLRVGILLSEKNIGGVKEGMEVDILSDLSTDKIKGKVSEVSRSAVQTGGQYLVKIDFEKQEGLLPGMFVRVAFPKAAAVKGDSQNPSSVSIPQAALVRKGQLVGVYVVGEQGTAILRWLKLGKKWGDQVEVLAGLGPDEIYILSAEEKLYNGSKINIQ